MFKKLGAFIGSLGEVSASLAQKLTERYIEDQETGILEPTMEDFYNERKSVIIDRDIFETSEDED